jgi:hypothetical protein
MTLARRRHTRAFGIWKQPDSTRSWLGVGRREVMVARMEGGSSSGMCARYMDCQVCTSEVQRVHEYGNDNNVLGLGRAVVQCCRQW